MIIANISTYRGQCADADHYYCTWDTVPDGKPKEQYQGSVWGKDELKRSLDYKSAANLARKDKYPWKEGDSTNRFDSFEEIHEALTVKFPNEIIVTYYEHALFKEMLYWKDGKNLGFEAFGEVWSPIPRSVYKDLIPADVQIKCAECGYEYELDDISTETPYGARTIVNFCDKRDMDEPCCKYFDLTWNVIL